MGSQYGSIDLSINVIDHTHVAGVLNGTPFASLKFASADALADVQVGRDALRSYFAFVGPSCVADVPSPLVILSLFPNQRVEVRLIRADGLSGLYELHR